MARSHAITGWDPEDRAAWQATGEAIARRNLLWSVAAEHVGFSVWSLWSVMVLFMPQSVYGFTPGDKFLIAATLDAGWLRTCGCPTPWRLRGSAVATGPSSPPASSSCRSSQPSWCLPNLVARYGSTLSARRSAGLAAATSRRP